MTQTFNEYSIFYKHSEDSEWKQWSHKWYISPKKAYSADKNSVYPLDLTRFHSVKMVERTYTYTDKDIPFEF